MKGKHKRIWALLFCGMLLAMVSMGCGKEEKMEEAHSAFLDEIKYEYDKCTAAPSQNVLMENENKTVVYQVTYHPDTTAKEVAKRFESEENITQQNQTTWQKLMWDYNRFCYENQHPWSQDCVYFSSVDWGVEVWKYVEEDAQEKSTTETLFFDRADGCYSIVMTYPTKDLTSQTGLYILAIEQKFQVDLDHIAKVQDGLETKEEVNEKGELIVTVTNNGEETAERVSCMMHIEGPNACTYDRREENVEPGQSVTFLLTAEEMEGFTDYRVDVAAFFATTMIDLEEEVWTSH